MQPARIPERFLVVARPDGNSMGGRITTNNRLVLTDEGVAIAEQVRQWSGDRVVVQGDNLHKDIEEALDGKKLSLVLDMVGGTPVGELAKSLKPSGSVVVYAMQSGQFPAISPGDLIYRGLNLHGFWLINWIRNAPRTEIKEIYQKLGDLVADGSLSATVEHVYPLNQFKEAFKQSLKSNRSGKILFQFGATDVNSE
jgi:NADPH:quinone reductase-like Zn-dependent oxidoreductase